MPAGNASAREDRGSYLSSKELAALVGVNRRAAQAIIAGAVAGKRWNGAQLVVRKFEGRGGRSGESFRVLVDSMPVSLQIEHARLQAQAPAAGQPTSPDSDSAPTTETPTTERESAAGWREFSTLPSCVQKEAKRRMNAVVELDALSKVGASKMERYAAIAEKFSESPRTIRRWWKLVRGLDRTDWLPALAPRHRGCTTRSAMSDDAYAWMRGEYFQLTKPALGSIYRRAKLLAVERGWALPSYKTVVRRITTEPRWLHALKRGGSQDLEQLYPAQWRDYSGLDLNRDVVRRRP